MNSRFVVFGNPIKHSLSPFIHRQFASQLNIAIDYQHQWAEVDGFAAAAKQFFADGGSGANVTSPFKIDAYQFANELTLRAKQAGAVNTLIQTDHGIIGDNTDGVGWLVDICQNHQRTLAAKNILILGAGGAARGLLTPIIEQNPNSLIIANRNLEKAQTLIEDISAFQPQCETPIKAITLTALAKVIDQQKIDIVINTTSIKSNADGFSNALSLPKNLLLSKPFCYDLAYNPNHSDDTAFVEWAKQHQLEASNGLGMLVEQAAESFFLWYNARPNTQLVLKALLNT